MILTEKSFIDPTEVLKSLVDERGQSIQVGNQEDVTGKSFF